MDVSLFASAVRLQLWPALFKSLEGTSVEYEVVFAGNSMDKYPGIKIERPLYYYKKSSDTDWVNDCSWFHYFKTDNIKPAQCYEIARRNCTGEVVVWVADDCDFPNDVIGKAYKYWKSQNNDKLILSIQTKESGYNLPIGQLFNMQIHRFFAGNMRTPLMAPLGLMSRKWLEELGGIDRRYVSGQYENDIVMRALSQGASVEVFGNPECYIDIDHLGKSLAIGESKVEADFLNRPFAQGYPMDRSILQNSWCKDGGVSLIQVDQFEPYAKDISLTKSESNKGIWE